MYLVIVKFCAKWWSMITKLQSYMQVNLTCLFKKHVWHSLAVHTFLCKLDASEHTQPVVIMMFIKDHVPVTLVIHKFSKQVVWPDCEISTVIWSGMWQSFESPYAGYFQVFIPAHMRYQIWYCLILMVCLLHVYWSLTTDQLFLDVINCFNRFS